MLAVFLKTHLEQNSHLFHFLLEMEIAKDLIISCYSDSCDTDFEWSFSTLYCNVFVLIVFKYWTMLIMLIELTHTLIDMQSNVSKERQRVFKLLWQIEWIDMFPESVCRNMTGSLPTFWCLWKMCFVVCFAWNQGLYCTYIAEVACGKPTLGSPPGCVTTRCRLVQGPVEW